MSNPRRLFKQDIDKYNYSEGCLPQSADIYRDTNTGNIDFKKWKEENEDDFKKWENEKVKCSTDFYNGEETGCCYNENATSECLSKDNNTGLTFMENGKVGNICHKEDVQGVYNTLFDDPNHIVKFLKLIALSILTLLVTAIIGTCYEFWFRYGSSIDCIYYKSKCANIGKSDKISLVDYMFPNNICYYPYQACSQNKKNQHGGSNKGEGIISTFAEYENAGAKCITIDYDSTVYGEKPIPYNLADYAINNVKSECITVLAKSISFYYLFTVLFMRKFFNYVFTRLSGYYQKGIKFNPFLSNLCFVFFTGLIFPLMAFITGSNGLYIGPMFLLGILIIAAAVLSMPGFFVGLCSTIFPRKLFGNSLNSCSIPAEYYEVGYVKLFYSLKEVELKTKVIAILKNIFFFLPAVMLILTSFAIGGLMSTLAGIVFSFSLIFNIFYIPLSNPLECFSILKSHADLLTILFCMGVIGSAAKSLDPITTGIMSMILVIIIIYKSFIGMKNSI